MKKSIVWKLWQEPAYRDAAAWHATSEAEVDEIRAFGIRAPVAVIPNGVDLSEKIALHCPEKEQRTLLFLSRIHPKKGLPELIEAWKKLAFYRPEWRLLIAGPDEGGHRKLLEAKVRQDRIPRIEFLDAVYGSAKDSLFVNADLFVLPTRSENFGMVVAEALAAGVPAIVTTGAPWQGLGFNRCGWWVEQGVEPLLAALLNATALPSSKRQAMGMRGREWMKAEFGWEAIGSRMRDLYVWLAGRGDRPICVDQSRP
jgi:glycosyltransferase involved in cell wall biosynthesis